MRYTTRQNNFKKLPVVLALTTAALLMSTQALGQETSEKVKHKVIEIKAKSSLPTIIQIDDNGERKVIELDSSEIEDLALLESKLTGLDSETQALVLSLMSERDKKGKGRFFFPNSDGASSQETTMRLNKMLEGSELRKDVEVFVLNDGEGIEFKGALKGHHQSIVKLIEHGEFTREQLNEIRAALDAKY
ncbi:hypothetical protein KJ365_14920 [Glaciecola sp. XM2]|uniref:hypothetical protein n=1 Tax=Glaciecola sp. XM2 TaxID=1914931 RepID=UPI001BDEC11E|nr:hypothetical protein [Glaciecola sp. XM2]MBT1452177.1 hypothetical protein [Glaciecola sp. XM2]